MRHLLEGQQCCGHPPPIGKAALIASAGGQRGYAGFGPDLARGNLGTWWGRRCIAAPGSS
jgi:hypothetical protein